MPSHGVVAKADGVRVRSWSRVKIELTFGKPHERCLFAWDCRIERQFIRQTGQKT